MKSYTTDTLPAVADSTPYMADVPSKNRVWNFLETSDFSAWTFASQPVESHQATWDTSTKTVSGMSNWPNRDPIGEKGGINIYIGFLNNPITVVDRNGGDNYHSGGENQTSTATSPAPYRPPQIGGFDSCKCCKDFAAAATIVNAVVQSGPCKTWFQNHGANGEFYSVKCQSYGFGSIFESYTFPGSVIWLSNSQCESGPTYIASLMIHEVAHHYSTWIPGLGREAGPMEAQDACQSQISSQ